MRFVRRYKFVLLFLAVLVFGCAMVVRQFGQNQSRHIELREAFILLSSKGYTDKAQRLYERLMKTLQEDSIQSLMADYQRTLMLIDPHTSHPENLVWRYHWSVSNELEKRNESAMERAMALSDEEGK